MQDVYYVVENNEAGFPRYLDGFTGLKIDIPVWVSDLSEVDPFVREETAMEHAKLAGHSDVRKVVMDDEGNNVLLAVTAEGRAS